MPKVKNNKNGKQTNRLARRKPILFACLLSLVSPFIVSEAVSFAAPRSDLHSPLKQPVLSESWLSRAQDEILKREYEITRQENPDRLISEAVYQSPNRRQGFRVYYTQEGIELVQRTVKQSDWQWGLRLHSYGYGGDLKTLAPAKRRISGNRITFERPALSEWYINAPEGLEQGFLIEKAPSGKPSDEIQIKIEITGDLVGTLLNEEVGFHHPNGGEVIHYGKLHAFDAHALPLATRFELRNKMLSVFVSVADARYPITIDPLVTQPGPSLSGGQAEADYGFSVATAGDVNADGFSDVVIGAPQYDRGETNEGVAFVYLGSLNGLSGTPHWSGEGNQAEANYGFSVAPAGDVNGDGFSDVVIGAPQYEQGQTNEGAAFLYLGSVNGLTSTQHWMAEGNQIAAGYGNSVAPAGDVNGDGFSDIVVGASQYDQGELNEGAAFLYFGSQNGLALIADWMGEGDQNEAAYGTSVAMAGDVNADGFSDVVIGAPLFDQGQTNEGAAFLYLGSANGLSASSQWMGEGNQTEADYGRSVGTAGDVNGDGYSDVIIGAPLHENSQPEEGRAFVYHGAAEGLETPTTSIIDGGQVRSHFGASVSSAGDMNGDGYADIIVGAPLYDNGLENQGRIRIFLGTAEGLARNAILRVDGNGRQGRYGISVATAGDVNGDGYADALVGAHHFEDTMEKEGAVFLHLGGVSGPEKKASLRIEGEQTNSNYGVSVASAGDVNGDGYADMLVGASLYDSGEVDEGLVFLYLGSADGLNAVPDWTAEGNQISAGFGNAVASAGDVNGDGYADVLVGASLFDNGKVDEGLVFLYLGSADGLSQNADWTAEGNQIASGFGSALASAGDVNGDGYGDVIIGAETFDATEMDEGRVFVYFGSARALSPVPDWSASGSQAASGFGIAVTNAGDVNADGFSDIAIGADLHDNEDLDEGAVFVYLGSAQGLSLSPDWVAEGNQSASGFGLALSSAGDVNGDGYADLLVGARFFDKDNTQEGSVSLYLGAESGLGLTPDWQAYGGQFGSEFGSSVASAGDVNGDGYADVLIGSILYSKTQADEGAAFLFLGSSEGLSESADWEAFGKQLDARFGVSVASAGDVNGDGYSDILVGAHRFDNGKSNEGGLFLYYGNGGRGVSLNPRQVRYDNAALISPLGYSDRSNALRLSSLSKNPFGGSAAKLEWEIKAFGQAFDGLQIAQSEIFIEMGSIAPEINVAVSNLLPKTYYHWRLRLHYDPASSPYQQRSRWFAMPNNAWPLADFKTRTGFLIAPAEEERRLPSTVTFVWKKMVLPNGNAADYQFCLKMDGGQFDESRDCSEIEGTGHEKNALSPNVAWAGFGFLGIALVLLGRPSSKNPVFHKSLGPRLFLCLFLLALTSSCRSGGGGGGESPSPPSPLSTTEIRHTVSDLSSETSYRWKVLVKTPQRVVDASEVRTFFTE